jgi:peptidoglycan/LPS O-acetylase OafA/YrhL
MLLTFVAIAFVFAGFLLLGLLVGWRLRHTAGSANTQVTEGCQSPPAEERLGAIVTSAAKTPAKNSNCILALDGLRVIAMVCILQYHWNIVQGGPKQVILDRMAHALMHFFFATSGFVNMLAEQGKIEQFDCVSGVSFFLKRMGRLCPLYYVALLIFALYEVNLVSSMSLEDKSATPWEAFPIQAAFGQGLWTVSCTWPLNAAMMANSPGWFVSDIMILSALFPVIYNLCPRSLGSCLFALAAMLVAQFLFVGVCLPVTFTYFWVGARVPEFVAGMLSARICNRMPPFIHAWSGWGWIFDSSVIVYCTIIVMTRLDNVLPIILSLILISAHAVPRTQGVPESGLLGRCLSCAPLQALSRYSFAVYILQYPVLKLLKFLSPFIPMGSSTSSFWPVWSLWDKWALPIIICHVAGVAGFHLIEEPAQQLADAYVRERRRNAGAAAQ